MEVKLSTALDCSLHLSSDPQITGLKDRSAYISEIRQTDSAKTLQ